METILEHGVKKVGEVQKGDIIQTNGEVVKVIDKDEGWYPESSVLFYHNHKWGLFFNVERVKLVENTL